MQVMYQSLQEDLVGSSPQTLSLVHRNLSRMVRLQRGDATQSEFADRIGVGQSQVSRWEKGESLPRLEQVESLAKDRGILPEQFVAELYGREIGSGSHKQDPLEQLLKMPFRDRVEAAIRLMRSVQ